MDNPLTPQEVEQIRRDFEYSTEYFPNHNLVSLNIDRWGRTATATYKRSFPTAGSYNAGMSGDDAPPYVSHREVVPTDNDRDTYTVVFDIPEDPHPTR